MTSLSPEATVECASTAAVSTWWQLTGFLRVMGPEAVTVLDGIVTQDIAAIPVGTVRFALFLTNKARIIAPVLAYREAKDCLLLETDSALVDDLVKHIKRYRLRAKAEVEAVDIAAVSIIGPMAEATAESIDGSDLTGHWYESPAFGLSARTFLGAGDSVAGLVQALPTLGARHADPEALDALRIEHGVPCLVDFAIDSMPAEVGAMEYAVSLEKGCYLGQEPVARLHFRGHPNRTLRQVQLADDLPSDYSADGGDYLALDTAEGKQVGTLTSWARSPLHAGPVGMAIVRREVENGTHLTLRGTDVVVTPTELQHAAAPNR
jgi:folate-binding protein YgfZ